MDFLPVRVTHLCSDFLGEYQSIGHFFSQNEMKYFSENDAAVYMRFYSGSPKVLYSRKHAIQQSADFRCKVLNKIVT